MVQRHGVASRPLLCGSKTLLQRAQRRLEANPPHQRAVETELPRDVSEQGELGGRNAAVTYPLPGQALSLDENGGGVKPAIDLEVMRHACQHRGNVGRVGRVGTR